MAEAWSAVPEWIQKAESDWIALQVLEGQNTGHLSDAVVFHAQQCVEKLLKARLIQIGEEVKKTHDLLSLSKQLSAVDPHSSWDDEDLIDLSSGGVLARYPGFDTSLEEAREFAVLASALRAALLKCLGAGGDLACP